MRRRAATRFPQVSHRTGTMSPSQREWTSTSAADTRELAEQIGLAADCGMVIALEGELGSGKTVFVQGLARGLKVPDNYRVTSPSFTIINEYPGRCRLIHVDLYRIEIAADLQDLGLVELLHGESVTAIEWAERMQSDLPEERLVVRLKILDDDSRRILIIAGGPKSNLLLQKIEL